MSDPVETSAGIDYSAGADTATQGTWMQCFDEESGFPYLYNDLTGETKWVDAATSNDILITLWQRFYDDNGDVFYYNPHTGESSWELPANAMVEENREPDHGGREDAQFADPEEEDVEYDGTKYIEAYNGSSVDNGAENIFDASLEHEESQEHLTSARYLNQSSLHSARSTRSASYIPMKLLAKKGSKEGLLERKTSFGTLEKKHSAQSLGIKTGSSFVLNRAPVVKDNLKPTTPNRSSKSSKISGFALLKVGATVVRKQIDENGSTWIEYQAANNGPIFYSQVDGLSAGQWNRPPVFDLEDMSSTSMVSVEPVDLNSLDEVLLSRPSSRKELTSASAASSFKSKGGSFQSAGSAAQPGQQGPPAGAEPVTTSAVKQTSSAPVGSTTTGPGNATKALRRTTDPAPAPAEETGQWDRKNLFGSFINSVFVETVTKEDTLLSAQ